MNIPEGMQCHCSEMTLSPVERELSRKWGLNPEDVHRFMDEWGEVSKNIALERRSRLKENEVDCESNRSFD